MKTPAVVPVAVAREGLAVVRRLARLNGKLIRINGKLSCECCDVVVPCAELPYVLALNQPDCEITRFAPCSFCDTGSLAAVIPHVSPGDWAGSLTTTCTSSELTPVGSGPFTDVAVRFGCDGSDNYLCEVRYSDGIGSPFAGNNDRGGALGFWNFTINSMTVNSDGYWVGSITCPIYKWWTANPNDLLCTVLLTFGP